MLTRLLRYYKKAFYYHLSWLPLVFFYNALMAQTPGAIIKIDGNEPGWLLRTQASAYRLVITKENKVQPVFYGSAALADMPYRSDAWYTKIDETPARGNSPYRTNILEVDYKQNNVSDLVYQSGELISLGGRPVLKIIQQEKNYKLQVTTFFRVISECDVIEKWMEIKNNDVAVVNCQNIMSGSVLLPPDDYVMTELTGHELSEYQPYTTALVPGVKTIENKTFKSNYNMPWFMVRPKSATARDAGPAWWGDVHYSGNWKIIFDNTYVAKYGYLLQIAAGINFWDTEWKLKPGETFTTPKFSTGYTNDGATGAAIKNQRYIKTEILPKRFRNELRPVQFNGWMVNTLFINDSTELSLARTAAALGAEIYTIDDGWFKNRNSSPEGLGDWTVDTKKFPNGLHPFIDSVHKLGMKFGLWFEPETVGSKTDLYKKHPEWALGYTKTRAMPPKSFLNLGREDVYQYLLNAIDKILTENKIDFIKWDQNSYLLNVDGDGVSDEMRGEVRIRFINNLYRLVDELRKRHPDILFESCASGGGRVDLGMLSRMDQVWTSDNSIAVDRVFIQHSFLQARPANVMESWVLGNWNYQQKNEPSIAYKFDVAMAGLLGFSDNINKWSEADKQTAKNKIAVYKKIRPVIQYGDAYVLASPYESNRGATEYVNERKDSAVVFCYNLAMYVTANYDKNAYLQGGAQHLDKGSTRIIFKELNPQARYTVENFDAKNVSPVYTGDYLMKVGIAWPLNQPFESKILLVKQSR